MLYMVERQSIKGNSLSVTKERKKRSSFFYYFAHQIKYSIYISMFDRGIYVYQVRIQCSPDCVGRELFYSFISFSRTKDK